MFRRSSICSSLIGSSICSSLIGPSTAVVVTGPTAGLSACSSLVHPFGSCRSCVCSLVARASDRIVVTGLLVRGWSAVRASLAMVVDLSLVHRSCVCSTRRWCVVGVLLMCRWCVVGVSLVCRWCASGPSLSYSCSWSLVRRSSVWSSITGASARVRFVCRWSVTGLSHESLTGLSVRVVVTGLFGC